jgi:predicted lysophospholipase L1 biosynthesis ABC-type transport system permease subunit
VPDGGAVQPGPTLRFFDVSYGVPVTVQRGDVLVNPPALVSGEVTEIADDPNVDATRVVAADLTTADLAYDVAGRLPQVPRSGPRGVLVDLETVLAGPSAAPAQTSYDVWLAADDPDREARLRTALGEHGLAVTGRDSARAHQEALAAEGPTLALRLAVLSGVVALLLAATVLVVGVATSGESRARDLAGLRVVGVPAAAVRSAAIREHLVIAVLGVLAGAVLGVVAARAALPRIPLFATPSPRLPLVLDPVWPAVGATVAGCLVLLCAVSVLVGRALAASATPTLLRAGR